MITNWTHYIVIYRFIGLGPSWAAVWPASSTSLYSIRIATRSAARDPSPMVVRKQLHVVIFPTPRSILTHIFLVPSDASSIHSDEDNYDDVKSTVANYQSARSQHYDQYRPAISPGGPSNPISPGKFCPSRRREKNGLIVDMFSSLQVVVSLVTTGGTSSGWNEPNRFTAVQSRFTTALNHQVRPVGRAISTVLSPCTPNPLPDRLPSRPTFTRRAELRCSRHRALIWLEMSTSFAPKAFTPLARRPSTEPKAFTVLDIRATWPTWRT